VCHKQRHGDRSVSIALPKLLVRGRAVVLMDDIASFGHTLAQAARALLAAGARSVEVAVTHALFAEGALALVKEADVGEVWSMNCIAHEITAVSMVPALATAIRRVGQPDTSFKRRLKAAPSRPHKPSSKTVPGTETSAASAPSAPVSSSRPPITVLLTAT
jgi:hypothetical protein